MQGNKVKIIVGLALGALLTCNAQADEGADITIGSISKKRLQLLDAKLDGDISEANKRAGKGQLPMAGPMPLNVPGAIKPMAEPEVDPVMTMTALFGRSNQLRGEVMVDGVPYYIRQGGKDIPGWTVSKIDPTGAELVNGKGRKKVLRLAAEQGAGVDHALSALPPLPNPRFIGLPGQ